MSGDVADSKMERSKWSRCKRNFCTGDLVLIVDDKAPRNSWLVGRFMKTISDAQGMPPPDS
ncbi:hypothetical protein N1851_003664 [Merluccius polli]|uniref:DUF5641 domain-containing protein n=1 Tax=Merluccius polli TaxID=89951 RepID=A0AA47PAA1_MERPO|nr:hypothetical protein N1851_003664 [Merluccius polli]